MAPRTKKRSSSGAHEPCPHCGKRLSGAKGLAMHQAEMHPILNKDTPITITGFDLGVETKPVQS